MKLHTLATTAACAFLLSAQSLPADAAGAKSKKPATVRGASTKPPSAARAGKSASRRGASAKVSAKLGSGKSKVNLKGFRTVAAAVPMYAPAPEIPLSLAQLEVARLVQTGVVHCEFGQSVVVEPQARRAGAFHVRYGKAVYDMVPEETSTGAVRLSDSSAGVVWLQIPVKSMLMDARQGQRMVDACTTPFQRSVQAIAATRSGRPDALATAADGLGIAPGQPLPTVANAGSFSLVGGINPPSLVPLPVAAQPAGPLPVTPLLTSTGLSADAASYGAEIPADRANGTGLTGSTSTSSPTSPPAQPGISAAVPLPAWAAGSTPAVLPPLPVRPQVMPN